MLREPGDEVDGIGAGCVRSNTAEWSSRPACTRRDTLFHLHFQCHQEGGKIISAVSESSENEITAVKIGSSSDLTYFPVVGLHEASCSIHSSAVHFHVAKESVESDEARKKLKEKNRRHRPPRRAYSA